jgi:hypothetical protein
VKKKILLARSRRTNKRERAADMTECFVCPSDAVIEKQSAETYEVHCPRCVRYYVTVSDADSLAELDKEVKPRVSRWIHDQCGLGTIPKIAIREIETLRNLKPLPFEERANRVLLYIAKQTKVYGASARLFRDPEFLAIAFMATRPSSFLNTCTIASMSTLLTTGISRRS